MEIDMKVMLIDTPYKMLYGPLKEVFSKYPPYGLMQISSVLKNNGFEVKVLDPEILNYDHNSLRREIIKFDPQILGISCMTSNLLLAYDIAKMAKIINPDMFVILGGYHASALPTQTLKECQYLDAVCIGEGEYTFLELARKLPLKNIRGLVFRNGSYVVKTPPRPLIENLDALPFPDFESVPLKKYRPHIHKVKKRSSTVILTSKGCPYSCYFCASHVVNQRRCRFHSVNRVLGMFSKLIEMGFTYFRVIDDEFVLSGKRIKQICELISKNKLDIVWDCNARVSNVNREVLAKMRKAGCEMITYGCESGNPSVLKKIRKGITIEQIRKAVKLTHELGIEASASWMLGHPWDTVKTVNDTIKLAKSLNSYITHHYFNFATPLPGTLFWEIAKRVGRCSRDWSIYQYQNIPPYIPPRLSESSLLKFMSLAHREVMLSKDFIFNRIKRVTSPVELKANLQGFLCLMKSIHKWNYGRM